MKCCSCSKELDVNKDSVPPKWYGMYVNAELRKVICADCIKTPEGRAKYDKRED
jgi:hypothetical protein